jgi:hypothetical protein
MASQLSRDLSLMFDALASAGSRATLFIQSDSAPTATVTAATLNGTTVVISEDGKIATAVFSAGTNVLIMTVEGVNAGDDVQLVEDCGATTSVLKKKFVGAAPGGADPVVSFRIHAT